MALKLGKCRLCLKLGDFYSIFTVDNTLQLAEMVMDCTQVKVYEGDGLPDKICSECVQKLSSAFIFKQQCERSDQELRRNYVPPPGFSTPSPPNRQSSDSAFSTHTDISNYTKPSSSSEIKSTPVNRSRKRSRESVDDAYVSSFSQDHRPSSTKRVEELKNSQKRPRLQSGNTSLMESDYDDNSVSQCSVETDSDEPLIKTIHKCITCNKVFKSAKSLANHMRVHFTNKESNVVSIVNKAPESPKKSPGDAIDIEDKLSCEKCTKTFKLKIMLKRHQEVCGKTPQKSPQKELLVSLEPIDKVQNKIDCEMCTTKFKTIDNLEKHMRICHAAVLKKDSPKQAEPKTGNSKVIVPCIFCKEPFDEYYEYTTHFMLCPKKYDCDSFECPLCQRLLSTKNTFYTHIRNVHFQRPQTENNKTVPVPEANTEKFECRMCNKKLPSQNALISHLSAHVSNMEETNEGTLDENAADVDAEDADAEDAYAPDEGAADDNSRLSTIADSGSIHSEANEKVSSTGTLKCRFCDKQFKYKKALDTHEIKHSTGEIAIKIEPPDKNASSSRVYEEYESDSSQEGDDNTCDICEKEFSYKRLLIHHKRTKHNMSSGTKRAKILLKDCTVRCLICDIEMKVSAINEHNQKHISVNIKPRNLYTCIECGDKSKSCSGLANHIKLVHRLKQQVTKQFEGADLADFCEVVVTKAEPLDEIQSHNDFGEVPCNQESTPLVNMSGFTCPICNKQMKTLISLKRHINWHTNVGNNIQKLIECFVCKETFRFQSHYKLHMRDHYHDTKLDPKLLTCTICNRKSKHLRAAQAHMNYHKQTRFKSKDYQCSICKRIFQFRKVYLSHMAIHFKRGDSAQNTIVGDIVPNNQDKTMLDGTHTCQLCGKVCDSENSLKCHTSWHNSKTLLYGARHECHICHLQFTNKRRREMHIKTHYEDDNGPFKCTVCGKGYIDEDYFRRHVKGHNFDHQSHKKRIEKLRKDKVKCPICNRYYPDLVKLIRHLRRTHPESKMIKQDPDAPPPNYYSCKLCAKVFLDEKRLQLHEEAHLRKPEFFKCKFCGKKTISLKNHRIHIKGHMTQKYFENPLSCPFKCEEKFLRGYDLHYHLRDIHDVNETWIAERNEQKLDGPLKEFQCSICLKLLASKGNFERHLDYHNSLRCNYCSDYFSSLRFLEGHLAFSCDKKKLIGETELSCTKKIKCYVCYKAFHLQVKLDCHLHTQHKIKSSKEASSGKGEFVCDYCFRVFENEYALSNHKIYHRTIGYYGCIYCSRKFNTLTLYRKHKNHHFAQLNVDNPTKCEHCDDTFVAFREMIYHMRDVHGDDKEWIVMPKESIEEKCNICNKVFYNLHRHLNYHEQNRCKKCGEYFYSRIDFDNHLCAIESDEEIGNNELDVRPKYEECRFCFKPITKKNSKLKHDLLHSVSGSISCRFCNHKFKTIDAFNIHAFSHRSRKYNKQPIKCRNCEERFVKYGPFMKHMKEVHKDKFKMHYRATVLPEPCAVCGDDFPNLHNHYRAHLQNQCDRCRKYFTSSKLFSEHECDKEDAEPSKVFTSDENLINLINTYIPKDDKDDEKVVFHIYKDADLEEFQAPKKKSRIRKSNNKNDNEEYHTPTFTGLHNEESQNSMDNEHLLQSPVISDVLSLYKHRDESIENGDISAIVNLTGDDDDDVTENGSCPVIITIEDDD